MSAAVSRQCFDAPEIVDAAITTIPAFRVVRQKQVGNQRGQFSLLKNPPERGDEHR
jgi:hypothetical protein